MTQHDAAIATKQLIAALRVLQRVPISNWTELDVWQHIAREHTALRLRHEREVIERKRLLVPKPRYIIHHLHTATT